jgi:hypothetical protein
VANWPQFQGVETRDIAASKAGFGSDFTYRLKARPGGPVGASWWTWHASSAGRAVEMPPPTVEMLPLLEEEAKKRQGARNDLNPNIPEIFPECWVGESRDIAAKIVGTNRQYGGSLLCRMILQGGTVRIFIFSCVDLIFLPPCCLT